MGLNRIMEVVAHVSEKTVTLKLSAACSIATLKRELKTLVGVPVPLQLLSTATRDLIDTDLVSDCDGEVFLRLDRSSTFPLRFVVSFCHFPLSSMTDLEVSMFSKMMDTGLSIFSTMRDTGRSIKAMIKRDTGTDLCDYTLTLGHRQLDDNQTVAEILAPGVFNLFISKFPKTHRFVAAQSIRCEIYSKGSYEYKIVPSETVSSFLERKHQPKSWLVYEDHVLEPATRLDSIHGFVTLGDLLLHIRTGGIASFDFAATSKLKVKVVRWMIEKRLSLTGLSLTCRGLPLKDNLSLEDCGCDREEIIEAIHERYIWVESDTERVSVRHCELGLEMSAILQKYRSQTSDLRDFQWMLLNGVLLQPGQYYLVQSGAEVEIRTSADFLAIATSKGIFHASISELTSALTVEKKFSKYFGPGQLFAKTNQLPHTLPLCEVKHMPLSFVQRNEQLFTFQFSDGSNLFVPFDPNTAAASVITSLQSVLATSDSLQLMDGKTAISGSISEMKSADFIYVCRNTEVVIWREDKSAFHYVALPSFKMKVSDLKTYCEEDISPLFFPSRLLGDEELLSDCNIQVGSCIDVLDSSSFTSTLIISPHKIPSKYIILRQLDSTQHLIFLHDDDSWNTFTERVQALLSEAFILLCDQRLFTGWCFSRVKKGQVLQIFKSSDDVVLMLNVNGNVEWIQAPRTFTLQQVKEAARVSSDKSLAFRKAVLDDLRTLESYSLTALDVLFPILPTEYIVTIRSPSTEPLHIVRKEQHPNISKLLRAVHSITGSDKWKVFVDGNEPEVHQSVNFSKDIWFVDETYIRIYGKFVGGGWIYVFVRKNGTVGDLRTAFSERLPVKWSVIRLLFLSTELKDESATLDQVKINKDSTVTILKPSDILVTITDDKSVLQLAKSPNYSVKKLKRAAAVILHETRNILLVYENRFLLDSMTLADLTTGNDLYIDLFVLLHYEIPLLFYNIQGSKTFDAHPVPLTYKQLATNCATSSLSWIGDLNNDITIDGYRLQADDELYLLIQTNSAVLINFYVTGRMVRAKLDTWNAIARIIGEFQHLESNVHYDVAIDGKFVDVKNFMDYRFEDINELALLGQNEAEVRIVLPNEQVFVLLVRSTASIADIKTRLFAATGISTEKQILSCGDELQNDFTIQPLGRLVKMNLDIQQGFQLLKDGNRFVVVPRGPVSAAKLALQLIDARIMCDDRELRGDEILPEGALLVRPGYKRIFVKTPLFPAIPVYIKGSDTIEELKERLSEVYNWDPSMMRLLATVSVFGDQKLTGIPSSMDQYRFFSTPNISHR